MTRPARRSLLLFVVALALTWWLTSFPSTSAPASVGLALAFTVAFGAFIATLVHLTNPEV